MATLYQKSDLKNSPQNDSRKETYVVLLQSASTALERLKSFAFISEESSSLFTQLELLATCRSSIDSMENILRQKQNCPDSNSHIEGRPINLFSGDASGAADGGSSRTISLTQPPTSRSKPPPPAPPVNAQNERSTTQQIPTSANSSFRGMPVRLSDSATSQGQESSIGQPSHSRQNSDPKSAANLLHDALFLADPREVIDTSRSLTPSTVFRPWASPDIPPSPLLLQYRELNRILYESTGGNGMGGGDMSIASMMSNIANTPSGKSEGDEISILSVSTTVTGSTSTRHRAIAEGSPIRHRLARVIYQILLAASSATVTSFRPANVAFELCRIDKDIFDRIRPEDIAKHRPPTNPSPSVHSSTEFFNYLTRLVEFTILEPLDPADRAFAIYIWVKIAWNLYQMRNLQSLKAIVSALGTPPVARLKRTWPLVQKKTMSMLDELKLLLSEQNNYSAYREWIVKSGTRPMVPFLGVYMHDITYLLALAKKDGSAAVATATERRIRDIFEEIEYYQNGPKFASDQFATMLRSEKKTGALNFKNKSSFKSGISSRAPPELQPIRDADEETVSQFVQHWILSRKWFTEKEMDALSLVREPRHLVDPGTPSGGVGLSTVSGTGHSQQSQPLGSSSATASGGPQS
ncbi:ras guanine nucleotide exchange factor domain-containing protein, partial [Phlyctochytrium arcticum]